MEINKVKYKDILKKLIEKAQPKHIPTLWATLILLIFFTTTYYQSENILLISTISLVIFALLSNAYILAYCGLKSCY